MHWNEMNSTQRWAYGGTAIAILAVAGALLFGHKHRTPPPAIVEPPAVVEVVEAKPPAPPVAPVTRTAGPTCPPVAKAAPKGLPTPAKAKAAAAKKGEIIKPERKPKTRHYGRGRGDDAVLP